MPSPNEIIRAAIEAPRARQAMIEFLRTHQEPYSVNELIALARKVTDGMGSRSCGVYTSVDMPIILGHELLARWVKADSGNAMLERYARVMSMSGADFEQLVSDYYATLGYEVRRTPEGPDQGADLVITHGPDIAVVQVKRYSSPVGNAAVQAVVAAIRFYGAMRGIVVTNSVFTSAALALASKNPLELIDGAKFQAYLGRLAEI